MKYNALIADDEMLARYSLKTLISKHIDDLAVAAEAENGRQAIELAETFKPNIVIMDIKMPGIDGLEASRQIKKSLPEAVIIILSAHDDFAYAQKALNDGFDAYMLKPFKKEEIISLIKEKMKLLDKRSRKSETDPDLRQFLEEEYIAFLIGDHKDESITPLIQSHLNIKAGSGRFLVLGDSAFDRNERQTIRSIMGKSRQCLSSGRTGRELTIFLAGRNVQNIEENLDKARRILGRRFRCGIGSQGETRQELEKSFRDAYLAYKNCTDERKSIFYSDDLEKISHSHNDYPRRDEFLFVEKLQKRDFDGIHGDMEQLIEAICRGEDLSSNREQAAELIMTLIKAARDLGLKESGNLLRRPLADLFAMTETAQIRHFLKSALNSITDSFQREDSSSDWWLERAFAYLRKNIYADISLETIADEIHVSPQHLGRIFKERYGRTVMEYITDQRMSYARYLLKNSELTIKEVSGKTGYRDQNYFARVFKKHTGFTPSSYKNSVQ